MRLVTRELREQAARLVIQIGRPVIQPAATITLRGR
jgi:hypothetical protein